MRFAIEKERRGWLLRCWHSDYRAGEIAYAVIGPRGPCADIEFPTTGNDHARAWVRLGLGLIKLAFSFPWPWRAKDYYQGSGPTYGISYFQSALTLHWGQDTGRGGDPRAHWTIWMPWTWEHVRHDYMNLDGSLHHRAGPNDYYPPAETTETHPYLYKLRNGWTQCRMATINVEEREWRWRWFMWMPFPRWVIRSINVEFNDEVGERSGSWKGGTTGCGYNLKRGETPLECLRRMEREREF